MLALGLTFTVLALRNFTERQEDCATAHAGTVASRSTTLEHVTLSKHVPVHRIDLNPRRIAPSARGQSETERHGSESLRASPRRSSATRYSQVTRRAKGFKNCKNIEGLHVLSCRTWSADHTAKVFGQ